MIQESGAHQKYLGYHNENLVSFSAYLILIILLEKECFGQKLFSTF